MKLIIEIENEEDLAEAEKLMKEVPLTITSKYGEKKKRSIEALIAYAEKNTLFTEKLEIPSREERNAR